MWPLIAAAIPAVASAFGQRQANKANVRLSREGMAFEADQVAKQMQFQERMSGTSYQRATEDMRLAGINPMLAYAQGGASTPGGGAASGAAATVQDVVGPAVASAQHARRLSSELQSMAQDRDTSNAQKREYLSREQLNMTHEDEAKERITNIKLQNELQRYGLPGARNQAAIDEAIGSGGRAAAQIFGGASRVAGPVLGMFRRAPTIVRNFFPGRR